MRKEQIAIPTQRERGNHHEAISDDLDQQDRTMIQRLADGLSSRKEKEQAAHLISSSIHARDYFFDLILADCSASRPTSNAPRNISARATHSYPNRHIPGNRPSEIH